MDAVPATPRPDWKARLKEFLVLGLLTTAPLAITLWVLLSVVRFLDGTIYSMIPVNFEPTILGVPIPGLGVLATFVLLLGMGFLAKTVAGTLFKSLTDGILSRIPVVGALYGTAKQISQVFFSGKAGSAFKEVVYVPFPSSDCRSLGFVAHHPNDHETTVFVPTAPNPTSGYVVNYRNDQIERANMSVDEGLKIIISCGALSKDG